VCISNCDKITPGMLMAALRLNLPTIFVSGGPPRCGGRLRVIAPVQDPLAVQAILAHRARSGVPAPPGPAPPAPAAPAPVPHTPLPAS
jgi:hypothetical protein